MESEVCNKIYFKWSKGVLWTTVSISVLLFIVALSIAEPFKYPKAWITVPIFLSPVWVSLIYAPLYARITEKGIIIKKYIGKILIPFDDIKSIKPIDKNTLSNNLAKIWGSSGVCGYLGTYKNPAIGKFRMYATQLKGLILITLNKADKKIVISIPDKNFLNAAERKTNQSQ